MFQFRRFPTHTYLFSIRRMAINHAGFPIRISTDQSLLSAPRGFFADRCVLRRLLVPRHSPYALCSLTKFARIFFWFFFGLFLDDN